MRHVTGTGKTKKAARGASGRHSDEAAARAARDRLAATAEKGGWARRTVRGGGFAARPDASDAAHLPAPAKKK